MKHPIYQTALDVQDASNLTGVILSLAEVARVIREEMEERGESTATENVNRHPAMVLMIYKMASLCGIPNLDTDQFTICYRICQGRACACSSTPQKG